jgi:anti-sigma B factor antagonist
MKENTGLKITPRLLGKGKNIALLTLDGYIDTTTASLLKHELLTLGQEVHRFIINFSGVEYVSSAGWGVILGRIRENREKDGDIVLVKMIKDVFSIYKLLDLQKVIKYFPNIDDGIRYYGDSVSASTIEEYKVMESEQKPEEVPEKLAIEDTIRSIVRKNPLLNSFQIKRILQGAEYGIKGLNVFKIYFALRRMGFNTREKRLYFAWQEEKKSKKDNL